MQKSEEESGLVAGGSGHILPSCVRRRCGMDSKGKGGWVRRRVCKAYACSLPYHPRHLLATTTTSSPPPPPPPPHHHHHHHILTTTTTSSPHHHHILNTPLPHPHHLIITTTTTTTTTTTSSSSSSPPHHLITTSSPPHPHHHNRRRRLRHRAQVGPGEAAVLIVASDGLWDVLPEAHAARLLLQVRAGEAGRQKRREWGRAGCREARGGEGGEGQAPW